MTKSTGSPVPFNYHGADVCTLMRDDEPWFVAADVCAVLGIANVPDAMTRLDEDEKDSIVLNDGNRGNPTRKIVNEPGLYSLVLRSDKPEAREFKRWITHDVLPTLRRTGSYTVTSGGDPRLEPHTLTWDETAALMRQRYGVDLDVTELCRLLRTAGVLKQNGSPRKPWRDLFWFTGSAWNIHPHAVVRIASQAIETGRELRDFRLLQMQLEYDQRFGQLDSSDDRAA